jgi:putative transposase
VKAGGTPGFPRFKGRNRFKSIEYTYGDGCKLRDGLNGRMNFYVQNVGEIRLCYHRPIPKEARLKHVLLKQVNQRWYVCIMLEIESARVQHIPTGNAIGMDIGLKSLVALSSGEYVKNPRWLQTSLAKLRRLQRHASREIKGSIRQKKSYARIARLNEHIVNQRADYLHKTSRRLVSEFDLIAMEDLSLRFMNRNSHLALSSHDAGLGILRQMIEYKAEEAGIQIISVNPSYTTQRCSQCGSIVLKGLSVRVHDCPYCGLQLDRDINAARNILEIALQKPLGRSGQDSTWAVAPNVF